LAESGGSEMNTFDDEFIKELENKLTESSKALNALLDRLRSDPEMQVEIKNLIAVTDMLDELTVAAGYACRLSW
jgi:uncharacterized membrane protein